jgi:site-specific recombinase XerC
MRRHTAARDRALLVLLDSGIRVSKCARLLVKNVALDTGQVHVEPYGSGRKTRGTDVIRVSAPSFLFPAPKILTQNSKTCHNEDDLRGTTMVSILAGRVVLMG